MGTQSGANPYEVMGRLANGVDVPQTEIDEAIANAEKNGDICSAMLLRNRSHKFIEQCHREERMRRLKEDIPTYLFYFFVSVAVFGQVMSFLTR